MKIKKKKYLLLILLLVVTIGFALLSTTLKINGIAGIKSNRWSIHWDDESISETQGSVTATTPANVSDTDKKIVSFEVDFDLPGDYYEFTVDAVNDGTIDGIIDSVKKEYYEPGATEPSSVPEYINYTVTYADSGENPKQGDILRANGGKIKYKVRVEFKSDTESIPTSAVSGTYKFEPEYIQHKDESVNIGDIFLYDPVANKKCSSTSETNCFEWVILSKYENNEPKDIMYLREIEDLTLNNYAFTVLENYISGWSNELYIDESYDLEAVTSGGPSFAGYEYGKARLPLSSEITEPVISTMKNYGMFKDTVPYDEVVTAYNNTYFGIAGYQSVYDSELDNYEFKFNNGTFTPYGITQTNVGDYKFYVHPVITLQSAGEDEFEITIPTNRTKDTLQEGDKVCLKKRGVCNECFDFIRYDNDKMVLIAMYNLNVGKVTYGEKTFIQNKNIIGSTESSPSINNNDAAHTAGRVPFSDTIYWLDNYNYPTAYNPSHDAVPNFNADGYLTSNYSVAYYVKKYKTILENAGAIISDARLLTYEEAVDLGCIDGGFNGTWSCPKNYISRVTYWLGSAYNTSESRPNSGVHICHVYIDGGFGHYYGAADDVNSYEMGVRPVIEIDKNYIK